MIPGQLDCSYGYRFCRMPQLCGHFPAMPSTPGPCPGGQPLVSQSPLVVCRHQLSTAAWANTMFWLMPHLQAAHRRICAVVPVKSPLTRGAICLFACQVSPLKKSLPTCWPVAWLYLRLTPLFSLIGRDRTHLAHCAPDGSLAPGLSVLKNAGPMAREPAGWGGAAGAARATVPELKERATAIAGIHTRRMARMFTTARRACQPIHRQSLRTEG